MISEQNTENVLQQKSEQEYSNQYKDTRKEAREFTIKKNFLNVHSNSKFDIIQTFFREMKKREIEKKTFDLYFEFFNHK